MTTWSACLTVETINSSKLISNKHLNNNSLLNASGNPCCTLEGHSNKRMKETRKIGGRERGGECPRVLQRPFVLAQPISIGFT